VPLCILDGSFASAGRIIKQGSNKVVTWVITWRYSALAYLQAKHNYATFSIITLKAETFLLARHFLFMLVPARRKIVKSFSVVCVRRPLISRQIRSFEIFNAPHARLFLRTIMRARAL
jgi:hypothetical protein